tara:strand:- start:456 stop:662 length:207 start_codon:yes stop_codon:yes gene_type:complete
MDKEFRKPAAYKSLNSSSVLPVLPEGLETELKREIGGQETEETEEESLYDQTESENIGNILTSVCRII